MERSLLWTEKLPGFPDVYHCCPVLLDELSVKHAGSQRVPGNRSAQSYIPIMHNVVVFLEKSRSVVIRKNILQNLCSDVLMFEIQHKNQANSSNGQNQGVNRRLNHQVQALPLILFQDGFREILGKK